MPAQLEDLSPGALVHGVVAGQAVAAVAVEWHGHSAVTLTYRTGEGDVAQRLVYRSDEAALGIEGGDGGWKFDADGQLFRLAAEAHRLRLAHLFDPRLAVHLSLLEPLPHQIQAVYGELLPRQPLRFALCDDPGAGKTIMAGLYIKELVLRGDLRRCLIVAPGGLVSQWQDELADRFGLAFTILTRDLVEASRTADPFAEHDLLIARLDHLSRNDDLVERLGHSEWDLVVVDEAHRMSAQFFGNELKETRRYRLGKVLGHVARHLLLMTATPHAGKEEDFQLFLALLDPDRFEGRPRPGASPRPVDVSDLLRRMVKERLLRFDGRPLFPERRATTVTYPLSAVEASLYTQVTDYVTEEMNRADRLSAEGEGRRGNRVGFAVTVLQRRLASSPEAIYQSLRRRRLRLEERRDTERSAGRGAALIADLGPDVDEDDLEDLDLDDQDASEVEAIEEELVDQATSARTLAELELEITTLVRLEALADRARHSGEDRKWTELVALLSDQPEMVEPASGERRKLIVFTEHRDTLNHLVERLRSFLGRPEAVVAIHGGVHRDERRRIQETFTQDKGCTILVATDAAGEGINLQRAHLLVNYDLPWNPNRIEQRFGRVHRIGQTEVCHMWNLVAADTREGLVYVRLLEKLEQQRRALGGQVFDVLGAALPGRALRDLLVEAIRYGDRPEVRARLDAVVDATIGDGLAELVAEHALAADVLDQAGVERIRQDMLEAEARRLQPHYVRSWFSDAFERLGGRLAEREPGRFEVTRVPPVVQQRGRTVGTTPVLPRYERVTFDKLLARQEGRPPAELVAPGHPLLDAVLDATLERHADLLRRGTVLVDEADTGQVPRVLVFLDHSVADGHTAAGGGPRVVSRRFEYAEVAPGGTVGTARYAPYLDHRPATDEERDLLGDLLAGTWLAGDVERRALDHAITDAVPAHLAEVRTRTDARVRKVRAAVRERLTREIAYWDTRAAELRAQADGGRQPRMNPDRAQARADELAVRLRARMTDLDRDQQLSALPPTLAGGALVVPAGLLATLGGESGAPPPFALDTTVVERRAVDAVLAAETRLGRHPVEQHHSNPGFDVRSEAPDGETLFLEVKGRIAGADTFVVTRNEILHGLNVPDVWVLALVEVSPDEPGHDRVRYLRRPFGDDVHLPFETTAAVLQWRSYWDRGGEPS
ncbi:MAG: SNF2-related protein [Actinomycetota bacterium]|nr:SNF2-related protein [Actinomycetota bacterium]